MAELQAVGILIAEAGIAMIAVNSILSGRRLLEIRESELKAREAQLRLQLIAYMNDERFEGALNEILWRWDWEGWDDYWEKYSPLRNPEANLARRLARSFYVGLASLVRDGLVDIETVYELNPTGVTRYWEKMGPIAREFRERNDYPGYLEPVEYLAGEVAKLRKRKGDPEPKPLGTSREPDP
jgi:hypothetical protein